MKYYSICLDIKGRKCVVVGGGRVAERKVKGLLGSKGLVTVISPDATEGLERLAKEGVINWEKKPYAVGDLKGAFLVIAATDDSKVQEDVYLEAESNNILLNVADVPEKCNFILPALVKRGDLTIGISTAGNSPALAKKLRKKLENTFSHDYTKLVEILGLIRPVVLDRGLSQKENEEAFNNLLASDILDHLVERDWSKVEAAISHECGIILSDDLVRQIRSITE